MSFRCSGRSSKCRPATSWACSTAWPRPSPSMASISRSPGSGQQTGDGDRLVLHRERQRPPVKGHRALAPPPGPALAEVITPATGPPRGVNDLVVGGRRRRVGKEATTRCMRLRRRGHGNRAFGFAAESPAVTEKRKRILERLLPTSAFARIESDVCRQPNRGPGAGARPPRFRRAITGMNRKSRRRDDRSQNSKAAVVASPDVGDSVHRRPGRKISLGQVALGARSNKASGACRRRSQLVGQFVAKPKTGVGSMHVAVGDGVASLPEPAERPALPGAISVQPPGWPPPSPSSRRCAPGLRLEGTQAQETAAALIKSDRSTSRKHRLPDRTI